MGTLITIDFSETKAGALRSAIAERRDALHAAAAERALRGIENPLEGAQWPETEPPEPLQVTVFGILAAMFGLVVLAVWWWPL